MSANVWNYLAGYVIIKIEGAHVARLVNRAVAEGVDIWDIHTERGGVRASLSVGGFYRLRTVAREYPCRIRIIEKHGLTIALCHMRERLVMAFGWMAALAALLISSRYMWFIEIEGCNEAEPAEILEILSNAGVSPGVRRGSLDTSSAAKAIIAADERIAWAGAELAGVVLQVSIIEAGEDISIREEGAPCSIYASNSGIIKKITALSGKPMVKAGDAVQTGDLLISGDLGNGLYTEARGVAEAEVLQRFTSTAERLQSVPARSGKSESSVEIRICGICLLPATPAYKKYETETDGTARMRGILPIEAVNVRHYELMNKFIPVSDERMKELARQSAEEKLYAGVDRAAQIIFKKSGYDVSKDAATCTIDVITRQNIAKIGEIHIQ